MTRNAFISPNEPVYGLRNSITRELVTFRDARVDSHPALFKSRSDAIAFANSNFKHPENWISEPISIWQHDR